MPQVTNFCLWASGKIYFSHVNFSAGHPGLRAFGLLIIFLRQQPRNGTENLVKTGKCLETGQLTLYKL